MAGSPVAVLSTHAIHVGIDLGGTKIEAVALGDDGCEIHRRRVATPQGDYAGMVEAVAALVEEAETRARRLLHLAVAEHRLLDDARLLHLKPEVVALARWSGTRK